MSIEHGFSPMTEFEFEGVFQPVEYIETTLEAQGAVCDVYSFLDDPEKDLGIIRMEPGSSTPLQRVIKGTRTVEGYVSGSGQLFIKRIDGAEELHDVGDAFFSVDVKIGDLMQWQAAEDSNLVAYEICIPPYEDGRFKNIE